MSIFAITTIGFEKDGFEKTTNMRRRTVGIFKTLEDAQKVMNRNYGGLNEAGWYPYAVIEEIEFGLYPLVQSDAIFYQYLTALEKWIKLKSVPEEVDRYMKEKELCDFLEIG